MDRESSNKSETAFFHPDLLEIPSSGEPPFLKGYRCNECKQLDFPRPSICFNCWGTEFEIVPLSRRGTLYSATVVFVGQSGMQTPYAVGYVDLPENLRIFAQLEGEEAEFVCDAAVELTVGTIRANRDGLPVVSYKFRPLASDVR